MVAACTSVGGLVVGCDGSAGCKGMSGAGGKGSALYIRIAVFAAMGSWVVEVILVRCTLTRVRLG